MPEKNETAAAKSVAKTVEAGSASGAEGKIVFCANLNSWRCVRGDGRQMLVTGCKKTAIERFPKYTVVT